jgi:hypothetical protein
MLIWTRASQRGAPGAARGSKVMPTIITIIIISRSRSAAEVLPHKFKFPAVSVCLARAENSARALCRPAGANIFIRFKNKINCDTILGAPHAAVFFSAAVGTNATSIEPIFRPTIRANLSLKNAVAANFRRQPWAFEKIAVWMLPPAMRARRSFWSSL